MKSSAYIGAFTALCFGFLLAPFALPAGPGGSAAMAFSKREIADAAYHWGRVDLAAAKCERLSANAAMRADGITALAKVGKQAWEGGYALGQSDAEEYISSAGIDAFCDVAWAFYGRSGQRVKNLIVRR